MLRTVFSTVMVLFVLLISADALDDPLKKRKIIPDVEIIIGDASRDSIMVANYSKQSTGIIMDIKLNNRFDRNDTIVSGNVAGAHEDEIIIAYGKKRDKGTYKGEVIVYAPDMHVIYAHLDVRYERYDGLAVCYLEEDSKGYERLVLGSRARDTIEVWSFFPPKKLAQFNVGYEMKDKIACGDVDGDGLDEVIMGDHSKKQIRVFKYNAKLNKLVQISRFSGKKEGIFDENDRLGAGDVDGDGIDEIVFLNNDGNVYFFDKKGHQKQKPIKVKYDIYSKMVVGDVNHDGFEEIIVGYAKDDRIWVYSYRGRVVSNRIKSDFERYDSLAVGDINGDSLIVGSPVKGKQYAKISQLVAVINAPPKEVSLIRKDGSYFYASFDKIQEVESGIKIEAQEAVFTTHNYHREPPAFKKLLSFMEIKTKRIAERAKSTTQQKVISKTIGYGLKADRYDTAVTIETDYQVYAYPILSPPELAFKNGERQYLFVTIPVSIESVNIGNVPEYVSSNHLFGYVATYPERINLLYNYTPDNEVAKPFIFNVKCDERHLRIGMKQADILIDEEKSSHQLQIDKKTLTDTLQSIIPGVKASSRKNFTHEKVTTHTISITDSTLIGVHLKENAFEYCLTEEGYSTDKYEYKVGVVVYYDSEDGHLVVDYFVPEKSAFFKAPKKTIPKTPFVRKNGKIIMKLKPAPVKNMKIRPDAIKLPM
ncbi:FG-GAP repeat domain-containing protein [Persephonella sp.]